MEWRDEAIVLGVRRHGERSAVLSLLTREQGRQCGLARGAQGASMRAVLQQGNRVDASWRARLSEHLGVLKTELLRPHAALAMGDAGRLAALGAACALVDAALPEREPCRRLFDGLSRLLEDLPEEDWPVRYARWEIGLLSELGYGLDLASCAVSGTRQDLCYVSPKTGRAVSAAAGAPWRHRLLPLPPFLRQGTDGDSDSNNADNDNDTPGQRAPDADGNDLAGALDLTGHFFHRRIYAPQGKRLPACRDRLRDLLRDGRT